MKPLWFVEAIIIATVLLVVGYVTLPEIGYGAALWR